MSKFKFFMVLSDGDTYSELDGCSIVAVECPDDDEYNDVRSGWYYFNVDQAVKEADGYYCFNDTPEFESNNGFTKDEVGL